MQITFETLKERAKNLVSDRMRDSGYAEAGGVFQDGVSMGFLSTVLQPALIDRIASSGRGPVGGIAASVVDALHQWEKGAHAVIDHWDVREVGALVKLFPEIVPSKYRRAEMVSSFDEAGRWMVTFRGRPAGVSLQV